MLVSEGWHPPTLQGLHSFITGCARTSRAEWSLTIILFLHHSYLNTARHNTRDGRSWLVVVKGTVILGFLCNSSFVAFSLRTWLRGFLLAPLDLFLVRPVGTGRLGWLSDKLKTGVQRCNVCFSFEIPRHASRFEIGGSRFGVPGQGDPTFLSYRTYYIAGISQTTTILAGEEADPNRVDPRSRPPVDVDCDMIINGEKYACEACVRGHRVSACSHSGQ